MIANFRFRWGREAVANGDPKVFVPAGDMRAGLRRWQVLDKLGDRIVYGEKWCGRVLDYSWARGGGRGHRG